MKKKNLIIITTLTVLILMISGFCISFAIKSNKTLDYTPGEFAANIKEITSKTKILDANYNHNQALDVVDFAKKQGMEIPPVLINFDTHSDIYLNANIFGKRITISTWINEFLAKNPQVNEVYWVMPKEEAKNPLLQILFAFSDYLLLMEQPTAMYGNSLKKIIPFKFIKTPLTKKAYKQTFLISSKGKMNEYADNKDYKLAKINFDNKNPALRKIKIITCTEDTLPDFKGRKVFLSIDADYISNSGFDTTANFINNKNKKQLAYTIFSMIKTIKEKNIRPEIINLTLSPEYLPREDHQDVIDFYNSIFEISKLPDAVQSYKYSIDEITIEDYELFRKNPIRYFIQN